MTVQHYPSLESALPGIRDTLASEGATTVICAPPGTGKTTKIPLALLDTPWASTGRILMLEPRRVAARAAAGYMASLLGEEVGETVGYRVRFERKVSARTRIEVLTEGLLVRRLQADPELEGVSLVIFDEVHERHLQTDLSLAMTLDARAGLRPDLRVAVMSATLAGEAVAHALGGATVIEAAGAAFAVDTRYQGGGLVNVRSAVVEALASVDGDVLVFLPGYREIRNAARELETEPALDGVAICPLYGALDAAAQDRVVKPHPDGLRKVILATNIAESSLTIDGVRAVVDAGLARVPHFDAGAALTRLRTERITHDSAEQRRGRAGRQAPGMCIRLWSASEHERLGRTRVPELAHADLAPPALQALAWGAASLSALPLLDAPAAGHVAQAQALLALLGAVNAQGQLTAMGRDMAALPVHPRLGAMLLKTKAQATDDVAALACRLAALIEEGLPWTGNARTRPTSITYACELMARAPSARGANWQKRGEQRVLQVERALCRALGVRARPAAADRLAGALLLQAFPDRVARRTGPGQFRMSNGRRLELADEDMLAGETWLVAAETSGERQGARLYIGAPVARSDLDETLADSITTHDRIVWDSRQQLVRMERIAVLGRLELQSWPIDAPETDKVVSAMLTGIRELGLDALPWTPVLLQLRARVTLVRQCLPNDTWPDLSDGALLATLETWLSPFLVGCSRRDHLRDLDLAGALRALVGFERLRQLDALAPERMPVPAGREVALVYQLDGPPVLAVPLQDMFGATTTPSILRGQVKVQVHLLSPAKRPLQVTQDLAGFWAGPYAAVRKEMRGRYPKHFWPADPASAPAGVRTGKRRPVG